MGEELVIDVAHPMRSLRAALGMTAEKVAAARGMGVVGVYGAERRGAGVRVSTLVEAARALGYRVEVRLVRE